MEYEGESHGTCRAMRGSGMQPETRPIFHRLPVFELLEFLQRFIAGSATGCRFNGVAGTLNRIAGISGGFYFSGIFVYLLASAVIPLTSGGGWRGPADVVAVGAYLSGIVPLLGLALVDMRVVAGSRTDERRLMLHASLVAVFLVVAHVAMIFGMLDPSILSPGSASTAGHGGLEPMSH